MRNKIKILITGAGGFIGRNLSNYYANKGFKIFALDNDFRGNLSTLNISKNIKYIKADVTKINELKKRFINFDYIFHLAAINGTKNFYEIPEKVLEVGILGTYNIIKLAKKHQIKKVFFASSSEVYNLPKKIPTDENIELKIPDINNERFSYSLSKIAGEGMIINLLKNSNTKYIVFRPHNVIGPNMGFEHVIPDICKKIFQIKNQNKKENKNSIKIQGNGNETRSFIYISDFIKAFDLIFKNNIDNTIINIGNDKEIKILNLIKIMCQDKKINNLNIVKSPVVKGSPLRRCPNIKKLKKLKYVSKFTQEEAILKTANWYFKYFKKN